MIVTPQVELLWCRADGDARVERKGKIYALIHAELLDYDVARRAEHSLEKHSHAADGLSSLHRITCCVSVLCHVLSCELSRVLSHM